MRWVIGVGLVVVLSIAIPELLFWWTEWQNDQRHEYNLRMFERDSRAAVLRNPGSSE